ncbi:MAG: GNAT family N-acetyltransferase [Deltaproteobacteria bacterium]|nr:GNAT family N-acetyltransferase [Nannocystaceae bacterium]
MLHPVDAGALADPSVNEVDRADIIIVPIAAKDERGIDEVAGLLVRSFRVVSPTWVPTIDLARDVVVEALAPGYINRALLSGDRIVGWIGARHDYGSVWELHPLVVDEAVRGGGIGRTLVDEITRLVEAEGALTLVLGTSDEAGLTNLAGRDLFRDPLAALQSIEAARVHPLGFWLKVGFAVVGVVPDAEGLGKPTIMLAKPVGRR